MYHENYHAAGFLGLAYCLPLPTFWHHLFANMKRLWVHRLLLLLNFLSCSSREIVPAKLTAEGKIFSCPVQQVVSGVNLDILSRGVGIILGLSNFQISFQNSDIYTLLRFFNLQYAHEMQKSVPLVALLHFCSSFDQVTFVFYYYYH